jgi:hypothetical protein
MYDVCTKKQQGKDIVQVENFANLVMTTNNPDALRVSSDDRRMTGFHCSDKYVGNDAYFDKLAAHLDDPKAARAVYQALMEVDLEGYTAEYGFQKTRPMTEYYRSMQCLSIPIVCRYLSALYRLGDGQRPVRIVVGRAFDQCADMAKSTRHMFHKTTSIFTRNMTQIRGVSTERTTNTRYYVFDWPVIYKYLKDNNQFDEEIELTVR